MKMTLPLQMMIMITAMNMTMIMTVEPAERSVLSTEIGNPKSGDLHAGKRGAAFLWLLLSEKAGERFPVLLQQ